MQALNSHEARVLGSLLEKQVLTPEYYPLTLRGLVAACNQKTSREPVMELNEEQVLRAVRDLMGKKLAQERDTVEGRVLKYQHSLPSLAALDSGSQAILTVLLLRGPQTAGELRGRTERMAALESPAAVEAKLQGMADRPEGALVRRLVRQPGKQEQRWAHLLGGELEEEGMPTPVYLPSGGFDAQRVQALEEEVGALRSEVESLKEQIRNLR